jgi:hypothetical protein
MKKAVILLLAAVVLSGCSLAINQAREMDAELAGYLSDDTLSRNCRAGVADALILAPDTSADIRLASQGVSRYADKESDEYKECYSKAAWVSFVGRGIASKGKKFIGTYILPGMMVP